MSGRGQRILLAVTAVLVLVPMGALVAIGWFGWRPGVEQMDSGSAVGATTLSIDAPGNGATIEGDEVAVRFTINGPLARPGQVVKNEREGLVHLHMVLGDGRFDTPEHSSSDMFKREPAAVGFFSPVAGETRTVRYRRIPPGEYVLRAELVPNDHDPGSGIANAESNITVERP